jgi:hypothetical protein
MAKKNKRGGKRGNHRELHGAIDELQDIEKDVARVRENLRDFLAKAEKILGGPIFKVPNRPPRPPK